MFLVFFSTLVFATNFRVKAAMKNSVLLSWEIRDKNPAQPFTVSRFAFCHILMQLHKKHS